MCVLLNIILYCGKSLCRYLVDLDAVSFVSWMAIMDGGVDMFVNACIPGNVVFSVPQFHVIIFVREFICRVFWGFMGGWCCMGLGCVQFGIGCRHLSALWIICSGRYGNLFCAVVRFGFSLVIMEYSSL